MQFDTTMSNILAQWSRAADLLSRIRRVLGFFSSRIPESLRGPNPVSQLRVTYYIRSPQRMRDSSADLFQLFGPFASQGSTVTSSCSCQFGTERKSTGNN